MTGWRLTSAIPAMMRSLSSRFEATRMWRRFYASLLRILMPGLISAHCASMRSSSIPIIPQWHSRVDSPTLA